MDDLSKLSTVSGRAATPPPRPTAALVGLAGAIQQRAASTRSSASCGRVASGEVDSWVSAGANQPVDPQRLGQALGPDDGPAAVGRFRHRHGIAAAAARDVPAADHQHAHDGRIGPPAAWTRRPGPDRPTSAACSVACWAAPRRWDGDDRDGRVDQRVRPRRPASRPRRQHEALTRGAMRLDASIPIHHPCGGRWPASGDAAGMDTTDLAASRVQRFLETEPVLWLSGPDRDGAPHLVPTWFAWDGETIGMGSKPGAQKVRNLRAKPRAMLAIGDAEADFDVGLFEATADLPAEPRRSTCRPGSSPSTARGSKRWV